MPVEVASAAVLNRLLEDGKIGPSGMKWVADPPFFSAIERFLLISPFFRSGQEVRFALP
jgi:hypothetical protein